MQRLASIIFVTICFISWPSVSKLQNIQTDVPTGQTVKHAGYLRIPFQDAVSTVDPGLTVDEHSIEVVEQLFVGLTDFCPKTYQVMPELATDWEANEEGTVYTFHLRKDAKWSDDSPITAQDIVWTIQRHLAPEFNAPMVNNLHVLKGTESTKQKKNNQTLGVKALDNYTVEFTLETAIGYFPALASLPIYRPLPRKVIEEYGDQWTEPKHIQTSGSYQLSEWSHGDKLVLTKNPFYYATDKVHINKVVYHIISDSILALNMYEKGALDIIGGRYLPLPQMDMPRITTDFVLRREIQTSPVFMTEFFGFNTHNPPLDNRLVRKAIAAAIDKKVLNDFVIWGVNTPATTFTRPPIFGSIDPKQETVGIPFNPKQAQIWLTEAGYPEGKDFPKLRLLYSTSEDFQNIALAVKKMLKHHLNIDVEIENRDWPTDYLNEIEQKTTHLFRMAWTADYPDANNWLYDVFHPEKGFFHWVWDNGEFTTIVEKAKHLPDPTERKQLYRRAEQILTQEDTAIIPIYFAVNRLLVKPWVKGWYNMAFGGQHIRDWRLEN